MTNREKIDKKNNQELTDFLINVHCDRCHICSKKDECQILHRDVIVSECYKGIEEWLKQEETAVTADEMFAELEFAIHFQDDYTIEYRKITRTPYVEIRLHRNIYDEWEYEKYFVDEDNQSDLITQNEDIAIHKKIKELKKYENKN